MSPPPLQKPGSLPPSPYESLEPQDPWWYSRPLMILVISLVVVGGLWAFWHMTIENSEELGEANLPVITADPTPVVSEAPEDKQVKNPLADKSVYSLISDTKDTKVPRLSPSSEEPLPQLSGPEVPLEGEGEDEEGTEKAMSGDTAPLRQPEYKVQIASLPSKSLAAQQRVTLEKKYGASLRGLPFHLEEATVSGKKTYRLLWGSFSTSEEAALLCSSLRAQGLACLVS